VFWPLKINKITENESVSVVHALLRRALHHRGQPAAQRAGCLPCTPHFRYTMINALDRESLIINADDIIIEGSPCGRMTTANSSSPSRTIPPYATYGLKVWDSIKQWVVDYIKVYYYRSDETQSCRRSGRRCAPRATPHEGRAVVVRARWPPSCGPSSTSGS
jgi:hypothetical protein